MIEGINSTAPQPEDRFPNAGPRYDEDMDIGIELEDGFFYQACREGAVVAIVADYPGLIPSSHVSTQDISHQKEDSQCALPTALFYAQKGRRSSRRTMRRSSSQRATPASGEALK